MLDLRPEHRLLDFGSGAGWPGISLAHSTGCELLLTDLPPAGLRRADRRLAQTPKRRTNGRCVRLYNWAQSRLKDYLDSEVGRN